MKIRSSCVALFLIASVVPVGSSVAQLTMMERTPELERIGAFLGKWSRSGEVEEGKRSPTGAILEARWSPGDVWMTWEVELEFAGGQTVLGRRHVAWDIHGNVYNTVWIDSQSAHVIEGVARWVDEKTFEIKGGDIAWHDGKTYRFKTHYTFASATEIHEVIWFSVDGGEFTERDRATWTRKSCC